MATNITVRGTDGAAPTYDPDSLIFVWDKSKIFQGPTDQGTGKYVANILSYAIDKFTHRWYQIIDVDWATLTPTFRPLDSEEEAGLKAILVGPGEQPKAKFVFLDTSKIPYEMSLDSRHEINGSENTYARVFRGSDTSEAGEVISAVFSGQTYLDDKIPLEMVVYDSHDITNLCKKRVPTFFTKAQLRAGEVVTVVVYTSQDRATHESRFIVTNSATVRPPNASQNFVTGITLESVFLNSNDPYTLDFPLNAPLGALNAWGIVHYNDQTTQRLPIDGTKFTLAGLEKFVATRAGQNVDLMLTYRLDPGEYSQVGLSADGKRISEDYHLVTTSENGLYSPILFGYPRWVVASGTYVMRWWLMDLARQTLFDATPYVQYNQSSEQFDGTKFDAMQFLSMRVELSEVSASLPSWIHTQTLYVKLFNPMLQTPPQGKWQVGQENVSGTFYGEDMIARVNTINQNNFEVNIGNNQLTLNSWLDNLYFKARPVYSLYQESAPPTPTHFTIINDLNNPQTFPIANWNLPFKVFTNLQARGNLVIRWDKQMPNGSVLRLATTELPMSFIS